MDEKPRGPARENDPKEGSEAMIHRWMRRAGYLLAVIAILAVGALLWSRGWILQRGFVGGQDHAPEGSETRNKQYPITEKTMKRWMKYQVHDPRDMDIPFAHRHEPTGRADTTARAEKGRDSGGETPSQQQPSWPSLPDGADTLMRTLRMVPPLASDPSNPSFQLPRLDGSKFRLKEARGKWVLMNFWATWCIPCRHEMPSMQRLYDSMDHQDFTILAVDVGEDTSSVRSFVEKHELTFPILMDQNGSVSSMFNVQSLPLTWLISPKRNHHRPCHGAA